MGQVDIGRIMFYHATAEACIEATSNIHTIEINLTNHDNKIDNKGEMSAKDAILYISKAEKTVLNYINNLLISGINDLISIKDIANKLGMSENFVADVLEYNSFALE